MGRNGAILGVFDSSKTEVDQSELLFFRVPSKTSLDDDSFFFADRPDQSKLFLSDFASIFGFRHFILVFIGCATGFVSPLLLR